LTQPLEKFGINSVAMAIETATDHRARGREREREREEGKRRD
jgi:hypothetical protein